MQKCNICMYSAPWLRTFDSLITNWKTLLTWGKWIFSSIWRLSASASWGRHRSKLASAQQWLEAETGTSTLQHIWESLNWHFCSKPKARRTPATSGPWKCWQTREVKTAQVVSTPPFQYLSYYHIWTDVKVERDAFIDTVWQLVPPAMHCIINLSTHSVASEEFLKINSLHLEPQAQIQQFYLPVQVTNPETTSYASD